MRVVLAAALGVPLLACPALLRAGDPSGAAGEARSAAPANDAPLDDAVARLGVLATRGPRQCQEKWEPTVRYLSATIPGHTFTLRPLAYDEVGPATARGELDFVLTNPSLYVELERLHGAVRIATLQNLHEGKPYSVYAAAVFRRSDREDLRGLADLRGKTLMAVEEWSLGGWQMAWREMKDRGIDPYRDLARLEFADTHDAVVHAVRDGVVDAGVVRADVLPRMAAENKIRPEDYRVLDPREGADAPLPFPCSTRAYPEWPLAKTRATSDELARKVAIALLEMPSDAPAAQAAGIAGWGIPRNYQPVHECLKSLQIGPYADVGKVTFTAAVRQYWPWLAGFAMALIATAGVSAYVVRLNRRLGQAVVRYQSESAERARAEEGLRRSEQLRATSEKLAAVGRLAAGVAHEINNPLTGVLTFGHLLAERPNLTDQDRRDLDVVIRETTRAGDIVRNLLDFARERPVERRPVAIHDVIRRAVRLLHGQKAFGRIALVERFAESLPEVEGDENQLQQVVLNLLLNACAAMPRGGTLAVGTAARDGNVLVTVADTGTGIKPEYIPRIFEPFFTTQEIGKGTGLGLSVSYGIVQQHGGTIEVESTEGKGTTFTILLPGKSTSA
ncbi:MAG: PhnD/SsuA/transferrin family substrate-binding protein [Pirellulales bacterium]|nr:PhnD/SsuA/transferrin family substrate-binding protein [Pirellulales bacterium]